MSPTVVFVLLQYKNLDQTLACIGSLTAMLQDGGVSVVVVDNFSSMELAEKTRASLKGTTGVHVICRPENDGYARGNNVGYRFAREVLKAEFVAVINNDTLVPQPDFSARLVRAYRKTKFGVLGPDIRVEDGRRVLHQNPSLRALTVEEVRKRCDRTRAEAGAGLEKPSKVPGNYRKTWFRKQGLVLHGAALVFSPRFLAEFDEPFDPRTFLYEEERILHARVLAKGLSTWYDPSLVVWHRTQIKDYKQTPEYRSWRRTIKAQSYQVLLSVLEENAACSRLPNPDATFTN